MTDTHALHHLVPLAQELDENKVTPGLLGFVVFAVIALALWALMKNMGKHMKKIDFDEGEDPAQAGAAARKAGEAAPPPPPAADVRIRFRRGSVRCLLAPARS
ncbi:hypothetical protein [Actinacidiphila yeochonensis]|uniref:hypothetical protein n=1 Tax=Actinacidiphila yeochonensis TaxID=89050 RepID=UPI002AFECC41|nr:hypothetical protein [Actinacidiphila yeochonensis]